MLAWGDDDLTMTWQWPTISLQMFSIRDFQVRLAIRQCRSKFNMSVLERSDVVIKKTVHVIFSIPICHHWWCVNTVQYTLYLYIHDRWEERGERISHTARHLSLSAANSQQFPQKQEILPLLVTTQHLSSRTGPQSTFSTALWAQ